MVLSWPEEWTAEHWLDAASHVLRVEAALRLHGWTLRTVRAQWIQFRGCRPVWISQAALAPFDGLRWPGLESCIRELLEPLRRFTQDRSGGLWPRVKSWWRCRGLARLASGGLSAARGEDLRILRCALEGCTPRPRWSPWQVHCSAPEPAGIAGVVAREEARLRGASLVYEWRQPGARAAKLAPPAGTAWVRFHAAAEEAAADYLEERAAGGAALPLVACPAAGERVRAMLEADLGVAVGAGSFPADPSDLASMARMLRSLARAAVVEFVPGAGLGWETFRAVFASAFRIASVVDAGAGRRVLVMERA